MDQGMIFDFMVVKGSITALSPRAKRHKDMKDLFGFRVMVDGRYKL